MASLSSSRVGSTHPLENVKLRPNMLSSALKGPKMRRVVREKTERVYYHYRLTVRVGSRPRDRSGRFKASTRAGHPGMLRRGAAWTVEIGGNEGDRWVGRVYNPVPYSIVNEYGRHRVRPYAGDYALHRALKKVFPKG